mgnify:CR=1 FL=1
MLSNIKRRNGLYIIALSITVLIIAMFFLQYIKDKQLIRVNTFDYFIQGTTIEASGLLWGSRTIGSD